MGTEAKRRRAGVREGSGMTTTTEPRIPKTRAGLALWYDMTAHSGGEAMHPSWVEHLRGRIVAIESEALAFRDEVSAAHDHDCKDVADAQPASPLAEPWDEGERT